VNCTSATTYNCDATVTFFFIAQQWITSDATTINISFSTVNYTQPPVQATGLLGVWIRHGDQKIFIMTHEHSDASNHFSGKKTRNSHATLKTHVTPPHALRNSRVPRNPCWRILSFRAATSEKFRGGKVTFDNDYDVIDVHSTMMRLFCYDQLTNIGGRTFFLVGGHGRPQGGTKFAFAPPANWNAN